LAIGCHPALRDHHDHDIVVDHEIFAVAHFRASLMSIAGGQTPSRDAVDGLSVVMIEARSATKRVSMSPARLSPARLPHFAGLARVRAAPVFRKKSHSLGVNNPWRVT
jgi:hypothetical protein